METEEDIMRKVYKELENLGWLDDEIHGNKTINALTGGEIKLSDKPDIILVDREVLIIIEVKKPGGNMERAIAQAMYYRVLLQNSTKAFRIPIVFAYDGKKLFVREFIWETPKFYEAKRFLSKIEFKDLIENKQAPNIRLRELNKEEIGTIRHYAQDYESTASKKLKKNDLVHPYYYEKETNYGKESIIQTLAIVKGYKDGWVVADKKLLKLMYNLTEVKDWETKERIAIEINKILSGKAPRKINETWNSFELGHRAYTISSNAFKSPVEEANIHVNQNTIDFLTGMFNLKENSVKVVGNELGLPEITEGLGQLKALVLRLDMAISQPSDYLNGVAKDLGVDQIYLESIIYKMILTIHPHSPKSEEEKNLINKLENNAGLSIFSLDQSRNTRNQFYTKVLAEHVLIKAISKQIDKLTELFKITDPTIILLALKKYQISFPNISYTVDEYKEYSGNLYPCKIETPITMFCDCLVTVPKLAKLTDDFINNLIEFGIAVTSNDIVKIPFDCILTVLEEEKGLNIIAALNGFQPDWVEKVTVLKEITKILDATALDYLRNPNDNTILKTICHRFGFNERTANWFVINILAEACKQKWIEERSILTTSKGFLVKEDELTKYANKQIDEIIKALN